MVNASPTPGPQEIPTRVSPGNPFRALQLPYAVMVNTIPQKPCPSCGREPSRTSHDCTCGYVEKVAYTKKTLIADKQTWRHLQDSMCALLWRTIEKRGPYIEFHRKAGRRYLILLWAARDLIRDINTSMGIQRLPPFDTPFVPTHVHPLTGKESRDENSQRREERIAMNGLRWEMMNWGDSFVHDAGGDVQHQILFVAMCYIDYFNQNKFQLDADGRLKD